MEMPNVNRMPGERKVIYISAILGIILFLAWAANRKGAAAAPVSESQDDGGGEYDFYDRQAEIDAAKEVSLAAIARSAGLEFSLAASTLMHDMGGNMSSKSGSGGLSIGGFSLFGGGGSSGGSNYDITTQSDFEAGFSATGLSDDEFQMALQQSAAIIAAAQANQDATYETGMAKSDKYKAKPKPKKAPKGHHLQEGPNGSYYWVRDGESIAA
jgi:hypothetical protein